MKNNRKKQTTVTQEQRDKVDHIAGYPHVTPETFENSYFLTNIVDEQAQTETLLEDTLSVKQVGLRDLPKNPDKQAPQVPIYDISFETSTGRQVTLKNRFAFIGYGANSSPEVLAKKYNPEKFGTDKDVTIPVIMTNINDHIVAHSAFFGGAGSVPVTMLHSKGDQVRVSTSFYTEEQVERMNSSEPNYDVLRFDDILITLNNGQELLVNPCVYDSIWGGLVSENNKFMTNNCIPHKTKQDVNSTMQAMQHAFNIHSMGGAFEHWVLETKNPLKADFPDTEKLTEEKQARLKKRMDVNAALIDHAKSRNLKGTIIQKASLTNERAKIMKNQQQQKPRANHEKPKI